MAKRMLIIGGTGIIGRPTVQQALQAGYHVTTVSLAEVKYPNPKSVAQIVADRHEEWFYEDIWRHKKHEGPWDIVVDVYNLDRRDAAQVHELFGTTAKHIIVLSTTLVYNRSQDPLVAPITSDNPLTKRGLLGGYVDRKLSMERYWHKVKDVPWTILRPYHIVGAGSYLGCLPDHNRDPRLLKRIKGGETLTLCERGMAEFSYVHSGDVARTILAVAGNSKTFGRVFNCVNPVVITARKYFQEIGSLLGHKVEIRDKPIEEVWREARGWELTTLAHVYDVSDLREATGYVPNTPLREALQEAIEHYPTACPPVTPAVHERMTLLPRPKPPAWLRL